MSSVARNRYLPALNPHAERRERPQGWIHRLEAAVTALPVALRSRLDSSGTGQLITAVNALEGGYHDMTESQLDDRAEALRRELRREGFSRQPVTEAFALVRELGRRHLGLRAYDVQIAGALVMLNGRVAEMDTGEGKTLTAALTAATAALAGIPVHVVTVNDYLAGRDARMLAPLYESLGLTIGVVVHGLPPADRAAAYASDVTYASNKEIAFDYLRDRLALGSRASNLALKLKRIQATETSGQTVMRGLHFAIVDEADSVLVDEARTPLIISRETRPAQEQRWAEIALELVAHLEQDRHFDIVQTERRVQLKREGRELLAEQGMALGGIWKSAVRREEAARQALTALHLFERGEHYLVRDGKVEIVDEYTGRVMADRSWSEGLHQLVEVKENCVVTGRKVPMARMTYQRFFRRYRHLAGMTGTGREVRGELWAVYGLALNRIPPNVASRRKTLPARIFSTEAEKWRAIAERTSELSSSGHPVLVGTRSVATSERLSELLAEAGLEHEVLNAAQDQREAQIIAQAGGAGRVTVATNMAGRGVDIPVDPGPLEKDGLHVILSERHDARRIDRQLAGRCARQGEPGVVETMLSLEDPLLELVPARLVAATGLLGPRLRRGIALGLFRWAQRRAERSHTATRRALLRHDQQLGTLLAFSGGLE